MEAEKELESAWELNPTFDVAYNLGNTKYQLKKHREAAQHLSFALRNWPLVKTVAKLKPTAEQRFAESRAQVGAVAVTVGVAGAEVLVDGKAVGRAPLEGEVFVEPGEHQVEARQVGYAPASQTVTVAKGATAAVTLALAAAKSDGATEGGGSAGARGPVAGPPVVPVEPLPPPPKRNWVPVIALGAASAVGLGVGIGMMVASNAASDDVDVQGSAIIDAGGQCKQPPSAFVDRCSELNDAGSREETLGNGARVVFAASGVLAVAAVTYALWPRPKARVAAPVRVMPQVGAQSAGVTLLGVW
ncbi:PEGA domain-containing protein [Sorangium sp. So ce448]|uniref:PEGA domain-containing protein n=1 Tax=Sorangium sp. So ce448 TaxID=3133314 RepID=UPI003F5F02B3